MANVSYPQYNLKTIVLPITYSALTIDEYKERFGIDLRDLIELVPDGSNIKFKDLKDTNIMFDISNVLKETGYIQFPSLISCPSITSILSHISGTHAGELDFYLLSPDSDDVLQRVIKIGFFIGKDDDFDISNLKVYGIDI